MAHYWQAVTGQDWGRGLESGNSSDDEPPEIMLSCMEKTLFISSRILVGLLFSASVGALIGGSGGIFLGLGLDWFVERWIEAINPEVSLLVAKIGLCAGVGVNAPRGLIKAVLYSSDYRLSTRKFLMKLI